MNKLFVSPCIACSTTETEHFLPPQCKYIEDGEEFDSFMVHTCNLEQCTTNSGPCRDSDRGCCCRAVRTEPISAECKEGSILSGENMATNETHCACTICDDIAVEISVLVREPGEGPVIPGAQVLDKDSGELIGLTYTNGKMIFSRDLGSKSVTLIVLAAGYLPREVVIELKPSKVPLEVVVALLRRNPVPVEPDETGYTFRLGDYVFITIPAGGFSLNGTQYSDVVMFDGVFMDVDDEGFLDMVENRQLVLGEDYFSLSFFTQSFFSDPEGNELLAQSMNYYVEVENAQENTFLTTYDHAVGHWVNLGAFVPSTSPVHKRQTTNQTQNAVFFVQLNTAIDSQFIFHAELANVSCWLQVRSFDAAGVPIQGPIGVVFQTGTRPDGMGFTFVFGTNTGSTQSNSDGLAENAICLPLACSGFNRATVEANFFLEGNPLTPRDFPDGTFNASEIGAPTPLGRFFTFEEVITSTDTLVRPFYDSVGDCIEAGMVPNAVVDDRSFFYFISEPIIPVLNNGSCFVKVRVRECFNNARNILIFSNGTGSQNAFFLDQEPLVDEEFSADHFLDGDCVEASRVVCIPFECNTIFQITVRDHTVSEFCFIERVSPIISISPRPIFLQNLEPQSILISTEELVLQDYNNPDLGLYHDPVPMVAQDMCRDPLDLNSAEQSLASMEGYLVSFDCILEN